jgi:hypothetical protein
MLHVLQPHKKMRCKQYEINEKIVCAKVCFNRFNDAPLARFSFSDSILSDNSTYFDDGDTIQREIRWKVYVGNYFFYDFGWNNLSDIVPDYPVFTTYGDLNLGLNNTYILSFLNSLESIIIPIGTKLCIRLDVKDSSGIESTNISNTYCFTK